MDVITVGPQMLINCGWPMDTHQAHRIVNKLFNHWTDGAHAQAHGRAPHFKRHAVSKALDHGAHARTKGAEDFN